MIVLCVCLVVEPPVGSGFAGASEDARPTSEVASGVQSINSHGLSLHAPPTAEEQAGPEASGSLGQSLLSTCSGSEEELDDLQPRPLTMREESYRIILRDGG